MHIADPLSRRSDHYVHSSEDNKEQVLLQPESVNKIVDTSEKSHDDRQSIISEFPISLLQAIKGIKLLITHFESTIDGRA